MMRAPVVRVAAGVALAGFVTIAGHGRAAQEPATDGPFGFLRGYVVLDRADRADMTERKVVTETLEAEGREVALFAASAIDVAPDRLIAKLRDIEALRTSRIVPIVRRFSDPPVLEDLSELVLTKADLESIAKCEPGDCDLKLTAVEIERLRRTIAGAGSGWELAVQREFRRLVLDRVRTYLAEGRRALRDYHDKEEPVAPGATFSSLLHGFEFLAKCEPAFMRYLDEFPHAPHDGVESFIYWSIETYAPKPIITVWQEHILRPGAPGAPEVIIAATQLFATHYLDGALSLTVLTRDEREPARRYLIYLNRVSVDLLEGFMAGVRRFFLERRLRGDSRRIFDSQRRRIEAMEGEAEGAAARGATGQGVLGREE